MPPWLISLLVSLAGILVVFVLNKLTTKSAASFALDIKTLQDQVRDLEKNAPTTEEEVILERRLTIVETGVKQLQTEVDFTKTSHVEFLRLLEKALIPVVHSPHTPDLDALLEKRYSGEPLTEEEMVQLLEGLKERAEATDDAGKRSAMLTLRAVLLTRYRKQQRESKERALYESRS
jgi:hypothetical protein